jgi:hypothetical protein
MKARTLPSCSPKLRFHSTFLDLEVIEADVIHVLLNLSKGSVMMRYKKNPIFAVIALAFATNVLFGVFRLINLVNVRFQYFYVPKVINISIFSPVVDSYIWIASLIATVLMSILIIRMNRSGFPSWLLWSHFATLASLTLFFMSETAATLITAPLGFLVIATTVYYSFVEPSKRLQTVNFIVICIVAMIGIIETLSLFTWLWNAFNYEIPFLDLIRWKFSWIDLQLFNLLYPWTAWLFVMLLYSWIWIPIIRYDRLKLYAVRRSFLPMIFGRVPRKERKLNKEIVIFSLLAIVAIAILVASYAYVHSKGSLVGTDASFYYQWLNQVDKDGLSNVFQTDERPLALLFTYLVQLLTALSSQDVVGILPIICTIGLSLAVFWFVRTGTRDDHLALTSALISVFSFYTTVGIYAYFLANWLAIILNFLLLTCMLKSLQTQRWSYTLLASLIGMIMLLTHPYTWTFTMVMITVYFVIILMQTLRKKIAEKRDIKKLFTLMTSNVSFYAIYALLPFGSSVGASGSAMITWVTSNLSLSMLTNVYYGIDSTIELWVGGLFANPLLLVLAIAGMLALEVKKSKFDRFLMLWIAVPSVILFTVSPDNFLFHRIIYLLPIQILATIGLQQLLDKMNTFGCGQGDRSIKVLKMLIVLTVMLFLINYALRSVEGAPVRIA